jgi:hypothetical protein
VSGQAPPPRPRVTRLPRAARGKPTPAELGLDPDQLTWERSGDGTGSIEVAFPDTAGWARGDWVLMRVAGDGDRRVLVFDRNEWVCFLDGARNGEFDDAARLALEHRGPV